MLRIILIVHRYLGVLAGVLMSLWCLSGFVMMYQTYPGTSQQEQWRGLSPLNFKDCCQFQGADAEHDLRSFRIESLNGVPVMRTAGGVPGAGLINLVTGKPVEPLSGEQLLDVARVYAEGNSIAGKPALLGIIGIDQWTVQSARRNAPVSKVVFDDKAATELYLSGNSGLVFQDTNRKERILTWLGAIPHWLYPLQLRQNGPLWSQVVIWTSVIGTFLSMTGIYVGIIRMQRRRKDGKLASPFRGWWYWHHMTGLFFGVLVLTWVFSGLLTMSPWGWPGGDFDMFRYRNALTGSLPPEDAEHFLSRLPSLPDVEEFVRIDTAPFNNDFYVLATRRDGTRIRLDAEGRPATLDREELESALTGLPVPVGGIQLLEKEDSFYYAYKGNDVALPVYRVLVDDEEQTLLYIDPATGNVSTINASERLNRWTRVGLHRLDFAFMKERPYWDIAVILLLAGVTAVCITGTWMSFRRVKRDFRQWRRSKV